MNNIASTSLFSDRLSYVINKLNVKKKDFAKKCGKSEPQLYAYLNGSQLPGTDFYRKLKEEYPMVNLNWLISEEGSPFIDQQDDGIIVPIDPAVGLVLEVENALGIKLKNRQRQAVVTVLRKDLDRCLSGQRDDIANLIASFAEGQATGQQQNGTKKNSNSRANHSTGPK